MPPDARASSMPQAAIPRDALQETLPAALQAGANSLGVALTDAQTQGLLDYLALIGKWTQVYNLTAVREPAEMLTHHLLDSLAVVPALERQRAALFALAAPLASAALAATAATSEPSVPLRLLDVGSGAGLPGVVIALTLPHWSVTCVDTVSKKVSFIRQASAELRLKNLRAEHARVEALKRGSFEVIVSRAFSSLLDFTQLTRQHLSANGVWLAMKGKLPTDEIAALPPTVEVFHVEHLRVPGLAAERCLVWMRPRALPSD